MDLNWSDVGTQVIAGVAASVIFAVVSWVFARLSKKRPSKRAVIGMAVGALVFAAGGSMARPTSCSNQSARTDIDDPTRGMLLIEGGSFAMGSSDGERDERPVHRVTLASFYLDPNEVTVSAYARCVRAGACPPAALRVRYPEYSPADIEFWSEFCNGNRGDRQQHPVNCVTWTEAETFCRWRSSRLPTEAEWEYAARGSDGRAYPWGHEAPAADRLNAADGETAAWFSQQGRPLGLPMFEGADGFRGTAPVGSYPRGASQFGALDMAGNVWEWVSDWYGDYQASDQTNPVGPSEGKYRVRRGGGWGNLETNWIRTAFRGRRPPSERNATIGFRCARGLL